MSSVISKAFLNGKKKKKKKTLKSNRVASEAENKIHEETYINLTIRKHEK